MFEKRRGPRLPVLLGIAAALLLSACGETAAPGATPVTITVPVSPIPTEATAAPDTTSEPTATSTPSLTPDPTPEPTPAFAPHAVEDTEPSNLIRTTAVSVDGVTLDAGEAYVPEAEIRFGYGEEYTEVEGIVTFRGNNFRDGGSYGLANMTERKFGESWYVPTGSTSYGGEVWTGSGWVGQPLIVKWPAATKAAMDLYDWAKEDDDLVEVIYATMDGCVYFLDLATGRATRDKLNLGFTFKGAGALDPRGYPILYLGAGYNSAQGQARVFIVSLLDRSILYTFGNSDPFALRGVSYFDGSPLVDAETDRLIYPGENGILYIMKLNTDYDAAAGTLSIAPDNIVKWRYNGVRTGAAYWLGMEDSAVIWQGHIIMADNGGNLMCLDLNTLELAWVQDILDDSNGSPVLSIEDGHPYIYISTSFHLGWRSSSTAPVPIWKIDAETGEILWHTDYTCYSESALSGGVQSTIALGKNDLEGYIYVTVAKTSDISHGVLACLDRETGEIVWEHKSYYTWSSPVLVYNSDGSGYVIYCDYYGHTMFLLDGLSGEVYDTFALGSGVEASPAVYKNTLVIGTRGQRIWGVKLK